MHATTTCALLMFACTDIWYRCSNDIDDQVMLNCRTIFRCQRCHAKYMQVNTVMYDICVMVYRKNCNIFLQIL